MFDMFSADVAQVMAFEEGTDTGAYRELACRSSMKLWRAASELMALFGGSPAAPAVTRARPLVFTRPSADAIAALLAGRRLELLVGAGSRSEFET